MSEKLKYIIKLMSKSAIARGYKASWGYRVSSPGDAAAAARALEEPADLLIIGPRFDAGSALELAREARETSGVDVLVALIAQVLHGGPGHVDQAEGDENCLAHLGHRLADMSAGIKCPRNADVCRQGFFNHLDPALKLVRDGYVVRTRLRPDNDQDHRDSVAL